MVNLGCLCLNSREPTPHMSIPSRKYLSYHPLLDFGLPKTSHTKNPEYSTWLTRDNKKNNTQNLNRKHPSTKFIIYLNEAPRDVRQALADTKRYIGFRLYEYRARHDVCVTPYCTLPWDAPSFQRRNQDEDNKRMLPQIRVAIVKIRSMQKWFPTQTIPCMKMQTS